LCGLSTGLVCPSRTSERGGKGDCVKEGGGEEGKRERKRALGVRLRHTLHACHLRLLSIPLRVPLPNVGQHETEKHSLFRKDRTGHKV
jgi:hypothetical protein